MKSDMKLLAVLRKQSKAMDMSVIVEKLDTIIEKLDDIASAIDPEVKPETGPDPSTEYDEHAQVDPGSVTHNEGEGPEGPVTSESPAEQGEN